MRPEIIEILKILASISMETKNEFCFCQFFWGPPEKIEKPPEKPVLDMRDIELKELIVFGTPKQIDEYLKNDHEKAVKKYTKYLEDYDKYQKLKNAKDRIGTAYKKLPKRDQELMQVALTGTNIDYSNLKMGNHRSIDEFPVSICSDPDHLILNIIKVFAKSEN